MLPSVAAFVVTAVLSYVFCAELMFDQFAVWGAEVARTDHDEPTQGARLDRACGVRSTE